MLEVQYMFQPITKLIFLHLTFNLHTVGHFPGIWNDINRSQQRRVGAIVLMAIASMDRHCYIPSASESVIT